MKSVDHTSATNDDRSDYRRRREKNNESVRKSRAKNRLMVQECAQSVQELKQESTVLNKQLSTLQEELVTLKGLFQHCFSFNLNNLSIKPNDIPTSTLYNIIMKKDFKSITNAVSTLSTAPVTTQTTSSTSPSSSTSA